MKALHQDRHTYLQHLCLNSRHGILNPLADFRVSTLPHWIVVLARFEEGGSRIYLSFIEDGVNGHDEEVPEGGYDCTIIVQCRGLV